MDGLSSALTIGAVVLVAAAAIIFAIAPRRSAAETDDADVGDTGDIDLDELALADA